MRIICPSCKAQYEIDEALLPADGREVQCSACGTVWFQDHPATLTLRNPVAVPEADPVPVTPEPDTDEAPTETSAPPATDLRAKPVDEKVLDILREEAAFEAEQRARDASSLETQPDLGLASPAPWPSTTATDPAPDASKTAQPTDTKVQPFPDIEDISASLEPIKGGRARARAQEGVSVPPTSAERSSSFLRGLTLPLAAAAILVGFYLGAPMIAEAVPALAPIAEGYVGTVDDLRRSVAGLMGQ